MCSTLTQKVIFNIMKCKNCGRTLAVTAHQDDGVIVCGHCQEVIPIIDLRWKEDGKFHFSAIGMVNDKKIADRVLLRDFTTARLDIKKALETVREVIKGEPNLRATCGEFEIGADDIYIVPLEEKKNE